MSGEPEVAARLQAVLGAPVERLERLSGGASRETWAFRAGERDLILRRDPPGRAGDFGSMGLEAAAIRAAAAAGLAVPEVVVVDDGGQLGSAGMVMARVDGETVARRILRDDAFAVARAALTAQLAGFLAGLHRIDVERVPELPEPDALEYLKEMYAEVDDVSPTFAHALRWLHRNRPPGKEERVVVHGDLRLGNVIVGPDGLRAVIDWELVHAGDPVEDLAWVCVKAWRFGAAPEAAGVGTIAELLEAYEAAGGRAVDRPTFDWWLVEKTLQWGIMCMKQAAAHLTGLDRSVELAAIGRRVAEVEWDLLELLAPETRPSPIPSTAEPVPELDLYGRPTAEELLAAAQEFLLGPVSDATGGQVRFHAKVAANVLATVTRQLQQRTAAEERARLGLDGLGAKDLAELSAAIEAGHFDGRDAELHPFLWQTVHDRLAVANPRHFGKG